jgi:hypothetical protein
MEKSGGERAVKWRGNGGAGEATGSGEVSRVTSHVALATQQQLRTFPQQTVLLLIRRITFTAEQNQKMVFVEVTSSR